MATNTTTTLPLLPTTPSTSAPPSSTSRPSSTASTPSSTSSASSNTSPSQTPPTTTPSVTSQTSTTTTSSTSASSTSSSTTPGTSTSSSPNTSTTNTTASSSTLIYTSSSGGQAITVTSVVAGTPSISPVTNVSSSSSGFFHNTGAVAGVFAVVGLVALALIIWIITAVVRRRRAKRFDEDVARAAAEAAASSHPADFDDYDYGAGSGPGGGMYGFSDNSNVGLAQAHSNNEAYGMSEIGNPAYHNYGPGAGAGVISNYPSYSATNVAGAGAAGIGAGGVFKTTSPDPYAAYAGPQDMTQQNPYNRDLVSQNISSQDWNDPGRYGAVVGMPVAPSPVNSLSRNQSQGANTVLSQSSMSQNSEANTQQSHQPLIESYASHYKQDVEPVGPQLQVRPPSAQSYDDPYGGITANYMDGDELPNPFTNASSGERPTSGATDESLDAPGAFGHAQGEARTSILDNEDYGSGKRVLKVANE